jgi:hypothetical protein
MFQGSILLSDYSKKQHMCCQWLLRYFDPCLKEAASFFGSLESLLFYETLLMYLATFETLEPDEIPSFNLKGDFQFFHA